MSTPGRLVTGLIFFSLASFAASLHAPDPVSPASTVKLIFIHHSTGGEWLADGSGGLGTALMNNRYFASATNYNWGPDAVGDRTDIYNWPEWFTGHNKTAILHDLFLESGQSNGDPFPDFGAWSRLATDPGGENQIVLFKSCFPNSNLDGNPDDPPLSEENSYELSVANAKAVYIKILTYFQTRQDKLFVVITAPPLRQAETTPESAANARAFNNWLFDRSSGWLKNYTFFNVAVFDYYNVLTSNGGDVDTNDTSSASGNHHRWYNGAEQHAQSLSNNYSSYPSGDSHPTAAGHQKATAEFLPLLNYFYARWKGTAPPPSR